MRDKSHMEQVIRWARFVKNNELSVWKPQVKAFVDSQIIMANRFYERLLKTDGGKEKVEKLLKRKV